MLVTHAIKWEILIKITNQNKINVSFILFVSQLSAQKPAIFPTWQKSTTRMPNISTLAPPMLSLRLWQCCLSRSSSTCVSGGSDVRPDKDFDTKLEFLLEEHLNSCYSLLLPGCLETVLKTVSVLRTCVECRRSFCDLLSRGLYNRS